jgi:hypothetical protein
VTAYRACDDLTALLLYLLVLFSPWALGSSQPWAIWVMNAGGYALGLLLLVKLATRWLKGYPAPRWSPAALESSGPSLQPGLALQPSPTDEAGADGSPARDPVARLASHWLWSARGLTRALAILTLLLLAFCLLSALNASQTRGDFTYDQHSFIRWLPSSLESRSSWFAFWMYLGLGCSFWSLWDWLLGKTDAEARRAGESEDAARGRVFGRVPARARRLIWLLSVNGAALALEGIVQRLAQMKLPYSPGQLLFLVQPTVNPSALSQFGPWAYRSNAAQYFNMLWPVSVGLWWVLHQRALSGRKGHHALLLCAALMAASTIVSASRAGAVITALLAGAGLLVAVASWLGSSSRRAANAAGHRHALGWLAAFILLAFGLGCLLGWKTLASRMELLQDGLERREKFYALARPMARDYPWFGTGPGTFEPIFQFYRESEKTDWPTQLHNDWLETRITFGRIGFGLIMLALVAVAARGFLPGPMPGGGGLVCGLYLGLLGCLIHARWDFPFQFHSTTFLFLVLSAALFTLGSAARKLPRSLTTGN